jgi:hypothetical protein
MEHARKLSTNRRPRTSTNEGMCRVVCWSLLRERTAKGVSGRQVSDGVLFFHVIFGVAMGV